MGIRDNRYVVDVPTVTAPIRRRGIGQVDEARFMRRHTNASLKFALPSPMTICDTLADGHFGNRADMAMAFAAVLREETRDLVEAGVDIIQFDEPAFNVFHDDVLDWGIVALERAIEGLHCKTAVHICYGYWMRKTFAGRQPSATSGVSTKPFFRLSMETVSIGCRSNAPAPTFPCH
jgi:5-methyltetrahydropteroyltriglutamate--homocysteine methyltransferase